MSFLLTPFVIVIESLLTVSALWCTTPVSRDTSIIFYLPSNEDLVNTFCCPKSDRINIKPFILNSPLHATETGDKLRQLWSTRIERLHVFYTQLRKDGGGGGKLFLDMVPSSSAECVSTRVCVNIFVEDQNAHITAYAVHAS